MRSSVRRRILRLTLTLLIKNYGFHESDIIVLMEYLLYSNIRRSGQFAHVYTFQCDTSASSVYTGDTYHVTVKYKSQLVITCDVDISKRERTCVTIRPNIVDFREVLDCVSRRYKIPALCLFLLKLENIKSDTHQFQSMMDIFRFLGTSFRSASSPLVSSTKHYRVTCRLTDIMLWHIEYNIIQMNEDIDESLFCSVFGERPQYDDTSRNWCRELLFEIVNCSSIYTDNIWKTYQLLRIISTNEVRPERRFTSIKGEDILTINTVHTMAVVRELSNSEIVSVIRTVMKISNHSFLLSLLSSDTLKHITNEKFLDIVAGSDLDYIDECSLFRYTLLVVDGLSDVNSDDTDCHGRWCKECVKSVLQAPVVMSASKGTCLYIIKGIIQNRFVRVMDILIQSPVCRRVKLIEILNIIKESKNYMFYKLFLEQISLSEDEVLDCIRRFICIDERTHIEESCRIEPGQDLITTILNSQRANITSGIKFYEIIKAIISHESIVTYKHVQCVLSNPGASTLTTDLVGELLVETFNQHDINTKDANDISVELRDSCTSLLLSEFIKREYDERTHSFARTFVPNVRNEKQYSLLINGCPLFLARISFDKENKPSLSAASLLTDCSEEDAMKALISLLSLECNTDKMLRMLLESLSINLCVENVEMLLTAVVDKELDVLKRRDLINEFEQPLLQTIGLKAVFDSKHGHVQLSQLSVVNVIEKMIVSYVDSSDGIRLMLDTKLTSSLDYTSLCHLLDVSVNTPFISTTEYIQMFANKADITRMESEDGRALLIDSFLSDGNQSEAVIEILKLLEEDAERYVVLNSVLREIIQTGQLGNPDTLDCLPQCCYILTGEDLFILVVTLVLYIKSNDILKQNEIQIHTEKLSSSHTFFVKLLHLYLSHDLTSLDKVSWIANENICDDAFEHGFNISIYNDKEKMVSIYLDMFRSPNWQDTYVRMHIQPEDRISRGVLVKLTLKAVEIERQMNKIVLIMLQNAKGEKLRDEDISVLLCSMIRRKYRGREEYVRGLLSSRLYTKLGQTSTCEALQVAGSSSRNNECIIDTIVSEAEKSKVTLSDDKSSSVLNAILECKHKRIVQYLQKILQSSVSPTMSDKTFLSAISTIMRHNISNIEATRVILFHKPSLSHECRTALEDLKRTGHQDDDADEEDEMREDENDTNNVLNGINNDERAKFVDDILRHFS